MTLWNNLTWRKGHHYYRQPIKYAGLCFGQSVFSWVPLVTRKIIWLYVWLKYIFTRFFSHKIRISSDLIWWNDKKLFSSWKRRFCGLHFLKMRGEIAKLFKNFQSTTLQERNHFNHLSSILEKLCLSLALVNIMLSQGNVEIIYRYLWSPGLTIISN